MSSADEFDMDVWDDLIATAGPSGCVAFDPTTPGGFRALTAEEDRALIDAVRAGNDRHGFTDRVDLDRDDDREVGA